MQSNAYDIYKLARIFCSYNFDEEIARNIRNILVSEIDTEEKINRIYDYLARSGYIKPGRKMIKTGDYLVVFEGDYPILAVDASNPNLNEAIEFAKDRILVSYKVTKNEEDLAPISKKKFWDRYYGLDTVPDPKLPIDRYRKKILKHPPPGGFDYKSRAPYNKDKKDSTYPSLTDYGTLSKFIEKIKNKE